MVTWKETILVRRGPFPLSCTTDKEFVEGVAFKLSKISGFNWCLVSRKLGCPLSHGIWTPVSRGHTECRSFQILLATLGLQKPLTVELLLSMLLKGCSKYSVNFQWMLVIVLTQRNRKTTSEGQKENHPQFFICMCCGFKTAYLARTVATILSVWILMALSIFILLWKRSPKLAQLVHGVTPSSYPVPRKRLSVASVLLFSTPHEQNQTISVITLLPAWFISFRIISSMLLHEQGFHHFFFLSFF